MIHCEWYSDIPLMMMASTISAISVWKEAGGFFE